MTIARQFHAVVGVLRS